MIKRAIDLGYRHLDTAFLYNNEQEVGEAIRDKIAENVISRSDIFVATKVCCNRYYYFDYFHMPADLILSESPILSAAGCFVCISYLSMRRMFFLRYIFPHICVAHNPADKRRSKSKIIELVIA